MKHSLDMDASLTSPLHKVPDKNRRLSRIVDVVEYQVSNSINDDKSHPFNLIDRLSNHLASDCRVRYFSKVTEDVILRLLVKW